MAVLAEGVLPQVPRGRIREIAASGTLAPDPASGAWEVRKAGVIIASANTPNDWNGAWNGTRHVVQPPPGTLLTPDYQIRTKEPL